MATQTPTNGSKPSPSLSEPTAWHPFSILTSSLPPSQRFALIALNQPLSLPPTVYALLWRNAHTRIGADGGANRVRRLDLSSGNTSTPFTSISKLSRTDNENSGRNRSGWNERDEELGLDTIIGDLDSLTPTTRKYWKEKGTQIIHVPDQDSTDFTKAVKYIRSSTTTLLSNGHKPSNPNTDIVVLGGLGGRVDQGLSVLHHLYMFQTERYSAGKMYLFSSESITFLLLPGKHRIHVKPPPSTLPSSKTSKSEIRLGKHIGIIPLLGPAIITTKGLEWDVENWETRFGGQMSTSNWVREEWVEVWTDRGVLFTVDLDVDGDEDEDEDD